ncbi:MAG: DNA topoisomerase 3 [Pseudomonadota bacterium]
MHWRVKLDNKKKELYDTIARFAKDATLIVHAGDPDREGQLLVDEVLERIGVKVPIKRVLISDMNGAGVRRAIKKMSDNADHTGVRDAALGRGRADWLYGLNLTRLYTVKGRATGYDGVLSVGRVQTPVLGLVVRRDREIEAFQSTPFYQLTANLKAESGTFRATWWPGDEHSEHRDSDGRILKRELVETVAQTIKDQSGSIVSVDKAEKRQAPPLPFSLPELQKAANKGRGFTARKTLDVAQALYEKHQIITYPRSDCRYLPRDQWQDAVEVRDAIVQSVGEDHAMFGMLEAADLIQIGKCWNDKKVTVHYAIIPTTKWTPLDRLTADERWLYELIAHRYILQFSQDRRYEQTDVVAEIGTQRFIARGRVELDPGWTQYENVLGKPSKTKKADSADQADPQLTALSEGEKVCCIDVHIEDKQTSPPKAFTEAMLLDAMTGIARFVSDPDIKAILKDTDGLGTPATQAGIIDTLFRRGYLLREGRGKSQVIHATPLGFQLIDTLPLEVTRPDMTAQWEKALSDIAGGRGDLSKFMVEIVGKVSTLTEVGKQQSLPSINLATQTVGKAGSKGKRTKVGQSRAGQGSTRKTAKKSAVYPCPDNECSGRLMKRSGSKGAFWGCSEFKNGCKVTRPDVRGKPGSDRSIANGIAKKATTNAAVGVGDKCPDCSKGKIQQRSLKNEDNAGKPFLGCSTFPRSTC